MWSPENRGAVDNGFGRGKPIMIMVGAFTSQTLSYSLWSFRFHELSIGNLLEGTQLWWLGHWLLKQFYIHFGVLELLIGNLLEGNPIIMVETLQCIDLPNTFSKNGKLFSLSWISKRKANNNGWDIHCTDQTLLEKTVTYIHF